MIYLSAILRRLYLLEFLKDVPLLDQSVFQQDARYSIVAPSEDTTLV